EEQRTLIPERIEKMFKSGWIEEVENLIKNGYNLEHYSMSGIGYKEIYFYLINKINYKEMRELILNRTNSFIKKQRTWFKKTDNRITWINSIEDNKVIRNISEKILNSYDNKVNANN
ncbi:MAG TPA: tRNA (adenosine(37)-N6)-dimethylallyltransferase MiaA, partial [Dehalococcoidia bacterium]|nr:tRNA (adenosine(37)-N6)-dimethylallyltransferase MiaA [Dehalococcoidia bacterium]